LTYAVEVPSSSDTRCSQNLFSRDRSLIDDALDCDRPQKGVQ